MPLKNFSLRVKSCPLKAEKLFMANLFHSTFPEKAASLSNKEIKNAKIYS
jgi:hypothetical protein